MRRDQVDEPAGPDYRRIHSQLAPDGADDAVDLAREAVDEPRLQRARGRLADHLRRLGVVDLDEPGGTREERVHRGLDPRSEDAADVGAAGRDDVEVGGRAEVGHDRRGAVTLLRRDRVDDAVRPDVPRRVVLDRDPGAHARADDEQLRLHPPPGDVLVLRHEPRHGRGEADPVDRAEVDEVCEQRPELVPRALSLGGDPPALAELRPVVEPEDGLRVADVDREQHRGASLAA
jgi:hypothetical protein